MEVDLRASGQYVPSHFSIPNLLLMVCPDGYRLALKANKSLRLEHMEFIVESDDDEAPEAIPLPRGILLVHSQLLSTSTALSRQKLVSLALQGPRVICVLSNNTTWSKQWMPSAQRLF